MPYNGSSLGNISLLAQNRFFISLQIYSHLTIFTSKYIRSFLIIFFEFQNEI
ncbi:hypothetical protein BACCAP_01044 [Pseudoflavonifractor capillosus ATCC 29799]|uniref:Uncharacterized protein n=1 Tax=Pseudoflavonifractor capillosus ATCC 29799 TaxID=411467 RepID=A6NS65_9FIRM|nr:hypothetical protein BACCAP_01044 [Pseudoflavonifractor capillosus ATCC 29799]